MAVCLHSPRVFQRIDHIGVAVEDLDGAIALYEASSGCRSSTARPSSSSAWRPRCSGSATSHVELLSPTDPESAVGRFIERCGPGLHHVAYQTGDIDAALEQARSAGLRLIDEEPRTGIRNSRVAFVHPKSTGGVLTELVQPAEEH